MSRDSLELLFRFFFVFVFSLNSFFKVKEIFQHYDLGEKANLEVYGTPEPAVYDMSKVTAPVYLYYGLNDLISTREVRENPLASKEKICKSI